MIREGTALADKLHDRFATAIIAYGDGLLRVFKGDLQRAVGCLLPTTEEFDKRGDLLLQIGAWQVLGLAYGLLGDTHQAIRCYERAIEITESRGELVYRSYSLWAMALAFWQQADPTRAAELLERGLQLTRRVDDPSPPRGA